MANRTEPGSLYHPSIAGTTQQGANQKLCPSYGGR
jgi:hypothetical protein